MRCARRRLRAPRTQPAMVVRHELQQVRRKGRARACEAGVAKADALRSAVAADEDVDRMDCDVSVCWACQGAS
jgi:hypothetical protein